MADYRSGYVRYQSQVGVTWHPILRYNDLQRTYEAMYAR
jgi:hypothetical protein